MFELINTIFRESWELLLDSSIYMLFGIIIAGLLKVFLNAESVARHLGTGKFTSVLKAALLGIPLPLCSCGVLPAAVSLKKQGANKGATTAFLISTPESGVDSIAVSYALLDPVMTVVRPLAAFVTAVIAGCVENSIDPPPSHPPLKKENNSCMLPLTANTNNSRHDGIGTKILEGCKHAIFEVWDDIAMWFFSGLFIAGMIMTLIPDECMTKWLSGGISSMLVMLVVGIPLYICATASTPVAAALILKGVSPGAALVFLLVGPATNITSLSVLIGVLGKKSTLRYLLVLSCCAILFGLGIDQLYQALALTPQAIIGEAAKLIPQGLKTAGACLLLLLSIRPVFQRVKKLLVPKKSHHFISKFPDLSNHNKS